MGGGNFAWGETSTLTFTSECNGSGTADDGVKWTVTSDGNESKYDSTKGIHYGTNSASVQYIQLSTSDISGTITKVVVNASTASGVSATASVTVGGSAFGGDAQSISATATDYTFSGSATGEIVVKVAKPSSATKAIYVKKVVVTYESTPSFTLTATSNNNSYGTVSVDGSTITATPADGYRVSTSTPYTVTTGTPTVTQNGNVFTFSADADCTVQINFEAIPEPAAVSIEQTAGGTLVVKNGGEEISNGDKVASGTVLTIVATPSDRYNFTNWKTVVGEGDPVEHSTDELIYVMTDDPVSISATFTAKSYASAVFYLNGQTYETVETEVGQSVMFPSNPASPLVGKTFVGWVSEAIEGVTDTAPESYVTSATMVDGGLTFYAVYATFVEGTENLVNDKLTTATFGSPNSYASWSGKTATDGSSAVYAGQSAGGDSYIQLRATTPSGIVSTTSGGKLKKITVEWDSSTASGRTLDVYCTNTAYSGGADLYNQSNGPDKKGSIVYGTSTVLNITGDYTQIGLRSNNGAMYLSSITITWDNGTPDSYSGYCTSLNVSAPTFGTAEGSFNAAFDLTLSCATAGATIYYTTDGTTPSASSTEYTAPIAIPAATTTVKAIAICDGICSEVVSATYTYIDKVSPTFTLSATDLNLKVNETGDITLTTNSDGAVTFTCDNANVEILSEGKEALLTASAAGNYTVTVTVAETATYMEKVGTVTVNVTKYATTTSIDDSDITITDLKYGTEAGLFSVTVTPEGKAALANPVITWTSSDETVATVDEDGIVTLVAAGTTNITASYAGDVVNEASSDTYELTVDDSRIITLWSENFSAFAADDAPKSGVNAKYECEGSGTKVYEAALAGGISPEILVGKSGGSFTATLKDMQFCTGTLTLTFKVNNTNISVSATSTSGDVEVTGDIVSGENTLTLTLPEKPADLTIIFANKKSSNVRLDNIVLRGVAGNTYYRNVTAGNFGTICLPRAASDLSTAGATFYEVAGTTESGLMLSEVNELEAGTPYVFKATASKLSIPVTGIETTVQSATGLVGNMSTTPVEVTDGNYILSSNLLRKVNGGKATIGQYRAYFDLSAVPEYSGAGVKTFVLGMDETPDGIKAISDATAEGTVYNLAGQRVNKAQKGIYIVNGKKILK